MTSTPTGAAVQLAFARVEAATAALRAAIELQALQDLGEQPIGLKDAVFKYGIPERSLRRLAAKGIGAKIGKNWYIYESRLKNFKVT